MIKKVKGLLRLFYVKRLTTVTGAWVYYFLMSVIPLAFLVASAFGVFGINIVGDIVKKLPEEFREAGEVIAQTAGRASNGVTIFFIITVVISITTLLKQMSKDGDFIYGVESHSKRGIMRRVWAIVALIVLFGVCFVVALLLSFNNILFNRIGSGIPKQIFTTLWFLFVILFAYAIIIVLYKYITPVSQKFSQLMLGALFALFVIVFGTIGFVIYLRYFKSYNVLYESLATIIIFLIWTYIIMLGLVSGVVVNMCAYERSKTKDGRALSSNTEKGKKKTTKLKGSKAV